MWDFTFCPVCKVPSWNFTRNQFIINEPYTLVIYHWTSLPLVFYLLLCVGQCGITATRHFDQFDKTSRENRQNHKNMHNWRQSLIAPGVRSWVLIINLWNVVQYVYTYRKVPWPIVAIWNTFQIKYFLFRVAYFLFWAFNFYFE